MSEEIVTVGRRKTAIARVRLSAGAGDIKINKKPVTEFFGREDHRKTVADAFTITNTTGQFDVAARVTGGGMTGQAGAIRHGISRALIVSDPALRAVLKKAGFLRRDPRMVERKKPGQKGARARFQFSKR
ncbi:MAG: 30S ribosomal protein S9 [Thermodesulfobacteriota bacterium]